MQGLTSSVIPSGLAGERRFATGLCLLAMGGLLVLGVGFLGPEVLHNAAHDTRHAAAFPCH